VVTGFAAALLFGTKEEGNAVVGPKDLVDDWDDPAMEVRDEKGAIIGYRTTRFDSQAEVIEVKGKRIRVRRDRLFPTETEVERKRDQLITWLAKTTETTLGSGADFIEIMQKCVASGSPADKQDPLPASNLPRLLCALQGRRPARRAGPRAALHTRSDVWARRDVRLRRLLLGPQVA
jgi:hypothetical protein